MFLFKLHPAIASFAAVVASGVVVVVVVVLCFLVVRDDGVSGFTHTGAPALLSGSTDAKVTIVVGDRYRCDACSRNGRVSHWNSHIDFRVRSDNSYLCLV